MVKQKVQVPPDGGWGWMIVLGSAVSNIILIPIMQGFGLIFQEKFKMLGFNATDSSIIVNINSAFGLLLGIFNGALLKLFGYRKVAFFGSLMVAIGITMTAFANTFTQFVITYGIITSIGMAWNQSGFHLALNAYFKEKRSKATGIAMTLVGLGPIFMPLLISYSISHYGLTSTVLLLGLLACNAVFASLLLQPVEWHMKTEYIEVEEPPDQEDKKENENIHGPQQNDNEDEGNKNILMKIKSLIYKNSLKVYYYLDLDLLKDLDYVIVMLGMSVTLYTEYSFSVLTPFILGDMQFTTNEVASLMSIIATVDIVFRALSPYIGDYLKFDAKHMYIISMLILVVGRSGLIFLNTYNSIVALALLLGIGKGIRTVYMMLVFSSQLPLSRLTSAMGLQTVSIGVVLLVLGPILGVIRDYTGNYHAPLVFINSLTVLVVIIWLIQDFKKNGKNKSKSA